MARGRVAQLVDRLHDGVQRRVVADGRVGAAQVVVDGARQPHNRDVVLLCEDVGTGQRAVAADDHQCVDAGRHHVLIGRLASLCRHELLAAGRLEDCAALLDDVADAAGFEFDDFIEHKALVATHNALDREALEDGRAGDRADCCIHAGGVASRGENADTIDASHNCRSWIVKPPKDSDIFSIFSKTGPLCRPLAAKKGPPDGREGLFCETKRRRCTKVSSRSSAPAAASRRVIWLSRLRSSEFRPPGWSRPSAPPRAPAASWCCRRP